MEKYKTILTVIAILFLFCIGGVIFKKGINNQIEYSNEIEQLQKQNDSLEVSNQLLDVEIQSLQQRSDSLQIIVQNKQNAITKLKKVKHEKIKAIHHFSNDKLFRFFAEFNTDSSKIGW